MIMYTLFITYILQKHMHRLLMLVKEGNQIFLDKWPQEENSNREVYTEKQLNINMKAKEDCQNPTAVKSAESDARMQEPLDLHFWNYNIW